MSSEAQTEVRRRLTLKNVALSQQTTHVPPVMHDDTPIRRPPPYYDAPAYLFVLGLVISSLTSQNLQHVRGLRSGGSLRS